MRSFYFLSAQIFGASFGFLRESKGSIAATFGIMLPAVLAAGAMGTSYSIAIQQKLELARAADASALAAVRQLKLGGTNSASLSVLENIAASVAEAHMKGGEGLTTKASQPEPNKLRVDLTLQLDNPLLEAFGWDQGPITAFAEAETFGTANVCVIALEDRDKEGVKLYDTSSIMAGDCGVYSNASSEKSIELSNGATITSPFICAVGGVEGGAGNFSSDVVTDCPALEDPLALRALPDAPAECDHYDMKILSGVETLTKGHYCGGLEIDSDAQVTFAPGIYFISDGKFVVKGEAKVFGEGVAIFMQDKDGSIEIGDDADVALSAPETGPLAGIVIASRSVCAGEDCHSREFKIKSPRVRALLGTIYIPEDKMTIDTELLDPKEGQVSFEAAFTIIVARSLSGKKDYALILNSDYDATSVPVPDGFRGATNVRLTR